MRLGGGSPAFLAYLLLVRHQGSEAEPVHLPTIRTARANRQLGSCCWSRNSFPDSI